jgi:hypothetical protein
MRIAGRALLVTVQKEMFKGVTAEAEARVPSYILIIASGDDPNYFDEAAEQESPSEIPTPCSNQEVGNELELELLHSTPDEHVARRQQIICVRLGLDQQELHGLCASMSIYQVSLLCFVHRHCFTCAYRWRWWLQCFVQ